MYFQKIFHVLFKAFDDEKLPIIDCVLLNTCRCSVFRAQSYLIPTLLCSVCSTQRALNFRMLKNLLLYFLHVKTMSPCNNSIKDNPQMQKNKFRITRTKQLKDMIEIDFIRRRHYRNGMLVDYRLSFLHKSHSCLCKVNSTTNFSRIPGFRR